MEYVPAVARWLHFMAGVMWIGLLYYFNFVQVAALKAATADGTAAGITKHVAPRALLYFRWAAVVTWLAGAALLSDKFVDAFTLRHGMAGIGVGAWLGTIMLFNVWALIWPNQQKILERLARQRRAVDADVVFHGGRLVPPGDLRVVTGQAKTSNHRGEKKRPDVPGRFLW